MKKLYLFGGGGHALSCIDVIEKQKKYKIIGVFDNKLKLNDKILNYPIIKEQNISIKNINSVKYGLVCVGQIKTPKFRIQIFDKILKTGFLPATVVSPLSAISRDVIIGDGTIIMHGSIINPKAKVGNNCIINTGCIIEHEVIIEDHCHISTGSVLNGEVIVKEGSFIGSGSIVMQKIIIGKNSVVPMGSIIKKNIK